MGHHGLLVWGGFTALVVALLAVDLLVVNRRTHALGVREAGLWSAGLAVLAILFGGFLWGMESGQKALEFYSGYLIELSLSVDNLFIFLLIFQFFSVPATLQPRVLKWGIFGAMLMRGIMIALGALLLQRFHWIVYLFGGILVITGIRMLRAGGIEPVQPDRNPVVKLARRFLPFTADYSQDHFFTRMHGRWFGTPLLLVVLVVEWSDLVFAIDSIPAIFAVTRDPFIVYSSNVFAILGLRALYFVLAGVMDRFEYLKPAVAAILVFVGLKMGLSAWVHVPTGLSLAVIVGLLGAGIAASLIRLPRGAS
ncbi:MAG TPA: TerC family protein [Gemmatimonadales bacterium]|nr:TerC family protein [Gemmatimonadales bacterium]